jgi:hypothetical protein
MSARAEIYGDLWNLWARSEPEGGALCATGTGREIAQVEKEDDSDTTGRL